MLRVTGQGREVHGPITLDGLWGWPVPPVTCSRAARLPCSCLPCSLGPRFLVEPSASFPLQRLYGDHGWRGLLPEFTATTANSIELAVVAVNSGSNPRHPWSPYSLCKGKEALGSTKKRGPREQGRHEQGRRAALLHVTGGTGQPHRPSRVIGPWTSRPWPVTRSTGPRVRCRGAGLARLPRLLVEPEHQHPLTKQY